MNSQKPILLVEDDQIDAMTIQRSLREIHVMNPLFIADDGEKALEILRNPTQEKPCIILLDLNMPKINGLELLNIIKHDDALKRIPVVVLTTSRNEQDRFESFNLGVAGYMIKPVDYHKFVEIMRMINFYWTLSELPDER